MNDLQKEIAELKEFIAALKADREAQREKERREAWTKYVSLTIVIVAVFAAIATQWAGKYSSRTLVQLNDATFNQAQASDQWAYYQAKSIKQNLYEVAREQLGKEPASTALLEKLNAKITKYEADKEEISRMAKGFEKQRDDARGAARSAGEHGGRMGLAVSFFSVAIAMSSISTVTKKKPLWFVSILLSIIAFIEMIIVWTA